MESNFTCAECAKKFPVAEIRASKCPVCYEGFLMRRKALEEEGYFANMKKLGSWSRNGARGRIHT